MVFGRVVEGMAVVKKMEAVGQRSGKPSRRVTISDCGQVRLQPAVLHVKSQCTPHNAPMPRVLIRFAVGVVPVERGRWTPR